ncbi:MFS transporter [Paracandidimonas soli]|uniref:MFS transporter n=1 Tax=Paracandidimonas soli TaxID=1917182 RepID=UPI00333EB239
MSIPVEIPKRQPLTGWPLRLALLALAMGGFGIGTGEFSIMGILPEVAAFHHVSEPVAGYLISAYAFGVVVGAPVIAITAARMSRLRLAILLMVMYAAANFASAMAPGLWSLMLFRFLSGLPHGAYFGVAALIAASLVDPDRRGFAVGRVMMGLTVAALAGNPVAIWLGQTLGWRYPFAMVGAISVLTILLILRFVPLPREGRGSSPSREMAALRNGRVWMTLAIGAIGFGGMFAVMSYVSAVMVDVTHLPKAWLPLALSVFGAGMIAGNAVGGWWADRALIPGIGVILTWSLLILIVFPFLAPHAVGLFIGVFLAGSCVALGPPLQVRLMDVAAQAQTLAASLNHSAFNLANAIGALLGGWTIERGFPAHYTGWAGALLSIAGLLVYWLAWRQETRYRHIAARAVPHR